MDERNLEDIEEGTVDHSAVLDLERFAVADHRRRPGQHIDPPLDGGEIPLQGQAGRIRGHLQLQRLTAVARRVESLQLVDVLGVGKPAIVALFVADVEKEHQAGREADRQAEDVDEGVGPALDQ